MGKKGALKVVLQRIEFSLIHRRFDRERAADIDAEKADVDTGYLFTDQEDSLLRQHQLFVEFPDLRVEQTESTRQPRAMHFERSQDSTKLPTSKVVSQLHHHSPGLLNGSKTCIIHGIFPFVGFSLISNLTGKALEKVFT